jgi:hypothetical protein
MTRDKTRAKEKARAEPLIHDGDSEEDADGSDDPDHQNPSQELPVDGQDGEVDGAPQGSPKGHKRSRINSAGQGAPVQVKPEKIKTLFEPLVRDTDGCALFPPTFRHHLAHFQSELYPRFHCPRPTPQLPNLRSRRIPSGPASQYDHRSQWHREKQHSLCHRARSQLASQCMRSRTLSFHLSFIAYPDPWPRIRAQLVRQDRSSRRLHRDRAQGKDWQEESRRPQELEFLLEEFLLHSQRPVCHWP